VSDPKQTIVVTGIGAVSPYGVGMAALEAGLLAGQGCIAPAGEIYPGFVGSVARVHELPRLLSRFLPLAVAARYSRTDCLAIAAAHDAAAGLSADAELMSASGVVMASTVGGLCELDPSIAGDPAAWYRGHSLARAATYPVSRVAESVGEQLCANGPRFAVSVACASGAMSIALAANLLLDGAVPLMFAGGSDALCPFTLSGFNSLQALDANLCRPFDQGRKGLNLGEAAAVLALETLAHAQQRHAPVLAVLRGWAMGNDASHPTAPHKDGVSLASCIRAAIQMAGLESEQIGYVNAHGTGTPLNDIAEAHAYDAAFAERSEPVPVSSTKSYTGHCLGAAGALEAGITIAAIRNGALFPTLRLSNPIESSRVHWLSGEVRRRAVAHAMSVSAGFGGSNAALVFSEYPAEGHDGADGKRRERA